MIPIDEIVARTKARSSCRPCPPASAAALEEIEQLTPSLPPSHKRLLSLANGISCFFGHITLFGLKCGQCVDLARWNADETWKFAWRFVDLSQWLCFAQTSWGEQFAYNVKDLQEGGNPRIYHLGVGLMDHGEWADDFEQFARRTLMLMSEDPFMPSLIKTYKKFGQIPVGKSLAYTPSLMLGGEHGDVEHMTLLDSESQLIIDGDIHSQVCGEGQGRKVTSVLPYQDERGRIRMKVNFLP